MPVSPGLPSREGTVSERCGDETSVIFGIFLTPITITMPTRKTSAERAAQRKRSRKRKAAQKAEQPTAKQ
jgi:hypothetical protein